MNVDLTGIGSSDNGTLPGTTPVVGTLNDFGVITVTGLPLSGLLYKAEVAAEITGKIGEKVNTLLPKLSWIDVLAISIVAKTKTTNPYTGRPIMYAGKRVTDEIGLILYAKEIAESGGAKSWNSIMIELQRIDPIVDHSDELTNANSPFNPASPYYNPGRSIWGYDPKRDIIIYSNGEIVWAASGKRYYDPANGVPVSFVETDGTAKTVRFSSGNTLDLVTLELRKPDGSKSKVDNELNFFQRLFRQLLTDTKTQLTVLGALVLLIILKKKRNEK